MNEMNPRAVVGWKEVPSLKGYFANELGEILGRSGRVLSLKSCKRGYLWFGVTGGVNVSAARAVCEAFHGPSLGRDCDHINRSRADNRPSNLRWVSRKENLENRECASGEAHWNSRLTADQVAEIKKGPHYRGFDSVMAKELGVARETVRDVRNGKQRSAE
ncbi:hypothetical protein CDV50_03310 [Haematobacter massiliensis]|uniref:HNH endonuclease signature motif containing protein n=1 Tax=Haematobacter massiliensis TaxID=195105 RepID=UPI000B4A3998|nr:HNH endonuclease signature motif containing protein [Haematobacter massiliensis]OWJ73322.1 hypothetical protein CDV50_03310 [Haematobacter massiliensis]